MFSVLEKYVRYIDGLENLYTIDIFGNVFSIRSSKKIKTFIAENGYKRVSITLKGKEKKYPIARLVAKAFIPNPNNYPFINHKNGNKLDNSIYNLEWCTASMNSKHAYQVLRRKPSGEGKFNEQNGKSKAIYVYDNGVKTYYPSISEAGRKYNVNRSDIVNVLKGRASHCHGLTFDYAT